MQINFLTRRHIDVNYGDRESRGVMELVVVDEMQCKDAAS